MEKSKLVALVVILFLLAVGVYVKRRASRPPDIVTEASFASLVPEGFSPADVKRVELYMGNKKDDAVVLARGDGGWKLASRYGAPADSAKVDAMLDKIKALRGEFRSSDPDVLGDYLLTDALALHCALYASGEQPVLHLLEGKGNWQSAEDMPLQNVIQATDEWKAAFVREAQSHTVYTVPYSLRFECNIMGAGPLPPTQKVEHKTWMQQTFIKIDQAQVKALALTYPDKKLAFEKIERPAKPEEAPKPEEAKDQPPEAAPPAEPPKPEPQWKVTEGGPGGDLAENGLNNVLQSLSSIRATDAADPAKKKDLGLEPPAFRMEVTLADGKKHVILAGRPDPKRDGYVTVEGAPTIYQVLKGVFDRLFPPAGRLFTLKGIEFKPEDVDRIEFLAQPMDLAFVRETKDNKLKLDGAGIGLTPRSDRPQNAAAAISGWKPFDYAEGADLKTFGLEKPWATIKLALKDGTRHTIAIGDESKAADGRYALIDDRKMIVGVSRQDLNRIKPEFREMFDLNVVDIKADDTQALEVARTEDAFKLTRKGDAWEIEAGGKTSPANPDKVKEALGKLAPLRAIDVFPKVELGQDAAIITVTDKAGKATVFKFGLGDRMQTPGVALDLKVVPELLKGLAPKPNTLLAEPPKPKTQ